MQALGKAHKLKQKALRQFQAGQWAKSMAGGLAILSLFALRRRKIFFS